MSFIYCFCLVLCRLESFHWFVCVRRTCANMRARMLMRRHRIEQARQDIRTHNIWSGMYAYCCIVLNESTIFINGNRFHYYVVCTAFSRYTICSKQYWIGSENSVECYLLKLLVWKGWYTICNVNYEIISEYIFQKSIHIRCESTFTCANAQRHMQCSDFYFSSDLWILHTFWMIQLICTLIQRWRR